MLKRLCYNIYSLYGVKTEASHENNIVKVVILRIDLQSLVICKLQEKFESFVIHMQLLKALCVYDACNDAWSQDMQKCLVKS